jgi:hypothetical protein
MDQLFSKTLRPKVFFGGSAITALSGCLDDRSEPRKVGACALIPTLEGTTSGEESGVTCSTAGGLPGCLDSRFWPRKVGACAPILTLEGTTSGEGSGVTCSTVGGLPVFFVGGLPLRTMGFGSCSLFSGTILRFAKSFFASSSIARAYK